MKRAAGSVPVSILAILPARGFFYFNVRGDGYPVAYFVDKLTQTQLFNLDII